MRELDADTLMFFDQNMDILPLYQDFEELLFDSFPLVNKKVQKMQITFSNRHVFYLRLFCASEKKSRPADEIHGDYPRTTCSFGFGKDRGKDGALSRKMDASYCCMESECWIELKRGKPIDDSKFYYLDAVEEALCFGWIDSAQKLIDGKRMQRFMPRKRNSPWTELNKERVRRLEKLGLMTDAGRAVLPAMGVRSFKIDHDLEVAMKAARCWSKFKSFPPLYQRVSC